MICPCGGRLQKRISDEGRAFECIDCGRYEVQSLTEDPDFEKFDYSLPKLITQPFPLTEDIGKKLLGIQNSRLLKENQMLRVERDRLRGFLAKG